MALMKIPDVRAPLPGDVYSVSINQGYNESPSTIDLSLVNSAPISPALGALQSINIGPLVFKGYLFQTEFEQKVGEKILHARFCDGSIILDQIQVGLMQRHHGTSNEGTNEKTTKGFFSCPDCSGKINKKSISITRKVRVGNYQMSGVYIMGNEEPQHSQCDFPDVNYSFGDLIGLMKKDMNVTFSSGGINQTYRNKFVGSLREVLSNWCAEFGYSFYWDYVNHQLVIYSLNAGIQIGSVYERMRNDPLLYIKSFKEKKDASSTMSHGYSIMKQMPSQTYDSQPTRNFFQIFYSSRDINCGGNLYAGAIAKTFGLSARIAYLINEGKWGSAGFSNVRRVRYSTDPKDFGPCNERTGIPTVCDAIRNYEMYVGGYSASAAASAEERDLCQAENYGKYFRGPLLGNAGKVLGNLNDALGGLDSIGACTNGSQDKVSSKIEPSPGYMDTPNGTIQGITLTPYWPSVGVNLPDLFSYKIEGQSIRTLAFGGIKAGETLFGIPRDYFKYKFRVEERTGVPSGRNVGTIIKDTGVVANNDDKPCGECESSQSTTKDACGDLMCDGVKWERALGFLGGGNSYIQVSSSIFGRFDGPIKGLYVGFVEQSITRSSTGGKEESYEISPPPAPRAVMNTQLTLIDANDNNNPQAIFSVPAAYADTIPRQEKSIEIVGLIPNSYLSELTPINGLDSYQINYGSEGITTVINFSSKSKKNPSSAVILSSTIASRGNYVTPKLGVSGT